MVTFIVWIFFILLEQKIHEKVCKNKDLCGIIIRSEKDNILKFNEYINLDKMPYIIYVDIESLNKKIDRCASNLKNFSTTKIAEHIVNVNNLGI